MDISLIQAQVESEIQNLNSLEALEALRVKYLGRKGLVTELTGKIATLPQGERAGFGQQVNALKSKVLSLLEEKRPTLGGQSSKAQIRPCDIGMPGIAHELGHLHILTQVTEEICAIFNRMGFSVVEGPEVETEFNNFTGLNIPLDHPSRDAFDTFYLKSPLDKLGAGKSKEKLLLRSHTSPVQIRVMSSRKPPFAVVVPGRVYRPDAVDASHSFMFNQIEGFMVDKGIRFSDLKGVLEEFAKAVFGNDIKMRFRPHFFPFTEPSAEVDISCIICAGHRSQGDQQKRCSVCGGKGWLEILGSGMIHPNVFKNVGIDPKKYTGFAFGMGVERIAMLKYGINDIRLFFENDLRFLKQF
ncbi:MAG: phenylalanine--tRNA ligase subunit alpha [Candidatus Omnitrophica bacterium]|nr:phenylalanine--tRNA ligase subunit alpha [Candidatus Omnitrophota bacterium]MBU1869013.1 phenylalanine--tRNA ligase subunit alpha [Candidatus Omnitrophota bacterium]